ncbi:MAG TPA: hypothetical protein VG897_10085 [Terriglobales bacterium]|nr:hypothetical protein [Terriglobales bacterium]
MHRQTHPVHFEDFGGNQFERLCFALLVRMNPDVSVEWIGQSGDDAGRDIVVRTAPPLIVQCANVRRLTFKKAEDDLGKLAALQIAPASDFLLVAGGSVGAALGKF